MIKDSFGKSLYFNHISHSVSYHQYPNSTPNGEAYTERARDLLCSIVGDLNGILARDYDRVLKGPTHSDAIEITKMLGYKETGNLRKSTKLAKKKRRDLARAVMFIDQLSENYERFYEDEKSVEWLDHFTARITELYYKDFSNKARREFAGDEAF